MLTPTASNRFSTSKVIMKTLIETMIAKSDDKFVTHNMKCSNTGHDSVAAYLHYIIVYVNKGNMFWGVSISNVTSVGLSRLCS